jgi:hypothetical protein
MAAIAKDTTVELKPFMPMYIPPEEFGAFGLPCATDVNCNTAGLVQFASAFIDEECGRIDGDGSGSLVYSTYVQRVLLQTRNRNLLTLAMKPIVAVPVETVDALKALAETMSSADVVGFQPFYTGVQPNTFNGYNGTPSGFIAASGRYGYTRQDRAVGYPDLYAMINPLNLVTMFGGPAPWVPVAAEMIEYDPKTGECWIPAGLQLQAYSEIMAVYNSGYDPRKMPYQIKFVVAGLVKNAIARGGVTGITSMSFGKLGASYSYFQDLLDPMLDRMLTPFKTVRGY